MQQTVIDTVTDSTTNNTVFNKGCRFTYFIVPASKRKYYICYAINRKSKTLFEVASAVYNPNSTQKFSKKALRCIAQSRLKSPQYCVQIENDNNDYYQIAQKASQQLSNLSTIIKKQIANEMVYHTLNADKLSYSQLTDPTFWHVGEIYENIFGVMSIKEAISKFKLTFKEMHKKTITKAQFELLIKQQIELINNVFKMPFDATATVMIVKKGIAQYIEEIINVFKTNSHFDEKSFREAINL